MRVHHLNCGTLRPPGGPLADGMSPWLSAGRAVCHCLLLETERGLVLVDTGIGRHNVDDPVGTLDRWFVWGLRPALDPGETAVQQVVDLGFSPRDVRHVVLTHLDRDHVGGLPDFPHAEVHVSARERTALDAPRGFRDRQRYAGNSGVAHGPRWVTYGSGGDRWRGFGGVRAVAGLDDVLLVPLPGHTVGHCAVAVRRDDGSWLLHAGDAFSHHGQLGASPTYPLGMRLFDLLADKDRATVRATWPALRALAAAPDVDVLAAHDARAFDLLSNLPGSLR